VEGGDNPEIGAKYHPFYITDDAEGGFLHKSAADKRVFDVTTIQGITSFHYIFRRCESLLDKVEPERVVSVNGKVRFFEFKCRPISP